MVLVKTMSFFCFFTQYYITVLVKKQRKKEKAMERLRLRSQKDKNYIVLIKTMPFFSLFTHNYTIVLIKKKGERKKKQWRH